MDFIFSLTHFCEVHGPTSIICSQVLPFSCSQCHPETSYTSPEDTPATSHDTVSSHGFRSQASDKQSPSSKLFQKPAEDGDVPRKIEDYPCFVKGQSSAAEFQQKSNVLGGTDGETCASCSLTLPEDLSKQLPPGAPGTAKGDGRIRNSSPVLRSRELVYSCGTNHSDPDDSAHDCHPHGSPPDSIHSSSIASDASCHTHILTYLSLRGPPNPADYALLRRSSIRTLSCELLPRGLSAGPLCFGDSTTGYTIAYIFRLPDPMARGKRRSYALVALAGKDARRAFRASPIIWRAFDRISTSIYNAAEKFQEEEKLREEQKNGTNPGSRQYTPVSSFLTGRAIDPDGQLRRPGQVRARNLTEIVGNPYIFAEIHAKFVALLQQLGSMFGTAPISEERFICSTVHAEGDTNTSQRPPSLSTGKDEQKAHSSQKRDDGDLGISTLDLSPGPKPIPIAPRRSVIA